MAKLTITDDQEAVVVALESALEQAYYYGVQDLSANPVLDAMLQYNTLTDPAIKEQVKNPFKSLAAALVKVLNIPRALPVGISTTVPLTKLTEFGSAGSLTFTDGLLVSKVNPT